MLVAPGAALCTDARNAWYCSCEMALPRSPWPAPVPPADEPFMLALAMRSSAIVCVWLGSERNTRGDWGRAGRGGGGGRGCGL